MAEMMARRAEGEGDGWNPHGACERDEISPARGTFVLSVSGNAPDSR
ncbi:MAG: hypothetical protein LBP64_08200 [Tannerella sp.]|nr:hypothetical protein [Tannerella sp.]